MVRGRDLRDRVGSAYQSVGVSSLRGAPQLHRYSGFFCLGLGTASGAASILAGLRRPGVQRDVVCLASPSRKRVPMGALTTAAKPGSVICRSPTWCRSETATKRPTSYDLGSEPRYRRALDAAGDSRPTARTARSAASSPHAPDRHSGVAGRFPSTAPQQRYLRTCWSGGALIGFCDRRPAGAIDAFVRDVLATADSAGLISVRHPMRPERQKTDLYGSGRRRRRPMKAARAASR